MYVEIVLGLLPVRYYPGASVLDVGDLLPGQDADREQLLARPDSMRRIIMPVPGGRQVRLFLHWADGTQLEELDERIIADLPSDGFFAGALVGTDVPLRCRNCEARFVGIVADTGTPLLTDVATRLRHHRFVAACPTCGSRWQPYVLHVIALR
ncbi:hypothetical protein [Streptomyces sp. NPDC050121]|uniref:hypothetical protein n=1 Tax=Streptomyces sp. NPDC050121 TaxID=3365601 RepID=UPI0037944DAA